MNKLTTMMLGAALLCGCQSADKQAAECDLCDKPQDQNLAFFAEERQEQAAVRQILQRQVDRGAAHDGMLRDAHFTDTELNRLGAQKVDAILRARHDGEPVAVYLDLSEADEQTPLRQEAVTAYLHANGIESEEALVVIGDNPGVRHMASLTSKKRYTIEEGNIISAVNEESDSSQSETTQVQLLPPTMPN